MDAQDELLTAAVDITRAASGLAAQRFLGTKGMSDVASGLTDALIIAGLPMGYEDIAPIPLIITEAGGRVSDLDGNDVLSGNGTVLASMAADITRRPRPAGPGGWPAASAGPHQNRPGGGRGRRRG